MLTHLSIIITKHSSFKDKEILRSSGYPKQPSNRAHTLKSYPQNHVMFDPIILLLDKIDNILKVYKNMNITAVSSAEAKKNQEGIGLHDPCDFPKHLPTPSNQKMPPVESAAMLLEFILGARDSCEFPFYLCHKDEAFKQGALQDHSGWTLRNRNHTGCLRPSNPQSTVQ